MFFEYSMKGCSVGYEEVRYLFRLCQRQKDGVDVLNNQQHYR